jgi:hypothetical protein
MDFLSFLRVKNGYNASGVYSSGITTRRPTAQTIKATTTTTTTTTSTSTTKVVPSE